MKTYTTLLITLLISISTFAQQGINYKAVIKDDTGNIIANTGIVVLFTIYEGDALTNDVYVEQHAAVTDNNGFVILNIGDGNTADNFNAINWANDEHFLNVQINVDGDGLTDLGTTQFMAVPYAKVADNVVNGVTQINDLTDGKSDTNGSSLFIGIDAGVNDDGTDNRNISIGANTLNLNTSGALNVATGESALRTNTTGTANTANGFEALRSNTTAGSNTAIGFWALRNNTTGRLNTANGSTALLSNTIGSENTGIGVSALAANTEGNQNSGLGYLALESNITGSQNTATGSKALNSNTIGYQNVANGSEALNSNTTGYQNVASGSGALNNNTTGKANTAIGFEALYYNFSDDNNTAVGYKALNNTTNNDNTGIGYEALFRNWNGFSNTAVGREALWTNLVGDRNVALGHLALFDMNNGNNNIGIGYASAVPNNSGSNQVRIGNNDITYAGIQVGWTVTSDKRWKENIRKLPYGLDIVMQLKPVDYIRKNNENKTREMGFIAQELEALLIKADYTDQGFLTKDDNDYLSVRYNDLIALLTKAIQEQQVIIEAQNSKIETQQSENTEQNAAIQSLAARMEQLEASN